MAECDEKMAATAKSNIDCTFKDCLSPGMYCPHDVIYHCGNYIVTDTQYNRVISINGGDGSSRVLCRGIEGLPPTCKKMEPYGIVALSNEEEDFLFTDSRNRCILRYYRGNCRMWNQEYLGEPAGIAINDSREVFVADCHWKNHCISVFNKNGIFLRTIGGNELKYPTFMAFNSKGELHVASDDEGIKVFDTSTGKLVKAIDAHTGNKRWRCRGVAIDRYDSMFVTMRATRSLPVFSHERVTIYDDKYEAVANFGGFMHFNYIRGVCIDYDKNFIVVVDGEWHRLQRYKLYSDHQLLQTASDASLARKLALEKENSLSRADDSDDTSSSGDLLNFNVMDLPEVFTEDIEEGDDNVYNEGVSAESSDSELEEDGLEFDDSEITPSKEEFYHIVPTTST